MKTFLKARWENIVMINYEVDNAVLQPYLPCDVELDTHNKKSFISLVGFRFLNSKLFGLPIPYFGSFDEVNLRFYVKRKDNDEVKRGVVFISEVVPFKIVSFMANWLYKEHYSYSKMKHECEIKEGSKHLEYHWQKNNNDFYIKAKFDNAAKDIEPNSLEEFIYEHYYGFTKINDNETWEYKVNHPRWYTNEMIDCDILCDFEKMYGNDFAFLNNQKPFSVYNAIGSEVSIDWKINKIAIAK